MSPEEKEKFKQKWNERCGGFGGRRGGRFGGDWDNYTTTTEEAQKPTE